MSRLRLPLSLLALAVLGWWAYAPGLHGTFLFDDFNNLGQLGAYGRIDNFRSLILYLSSGNADPIGRPLALLTFLVDANNWPADPAPFKRSNILLHLINGLLLSLVLLKLGRKLALTEARAQAAAVLGAALWTLHPLFVSTTLYAVQREAMLPATFTLLGMLSWLAGRERLMHGRGGGLPLLLFAAWGFTLLAMLSKANGLLLPVLLLAMEWTVLQRDADADVPSTRQARRWLLLLPSSLIAAWLLSYVPAVFSGDAGSRPWSPAQRLMTEPRVLCDYLQLLWLPRATGSSVFNDGFRLSTDLFHPWSTLPALGLIAALLVAGLRLRRSQPALAFAILFYFAGQLVESTLIPLELYFEHRNYLPALMMFWPPALWLTGDGRLPRLRLGVTAVLPLLLLALCHARAAIWGQPVEQALLLAHLDPHSPRAQVNAASYEVAQGRPDLAAARLTRAIGDMPDEAQLAVNLVDAECAAGGISRDTLAKAEYALGRNHQQAELVQNWLIGAVGNAAQGNCKGLDFAALAQLIAAVRGNPYYSTGPGHTHDMLDLDGRMALAQGQGEQALQAFDSSLVVFATPDGALLQAALLGGSGFPALGLRHLEYYKTLPPSDRHLRGMAAIHAWLLARQGYWTEEFDHMESQLRQDAAAANSADPKAPAQ